MSSDVLVNLLQPGMLLHIEHENKKEPFIVELKKYYASDQTLEVQHFSPQKPKHKGPLQLININECLKVQVIKPGEVNTNVNGTNATDNKASAKTTEIFDAKLKLLPHEVKQIEKLLTESIFINSNAQPDYQSALDAIESHEGLLSFVVANTTNLFAVSTNKQIYIFDILALGGQVPKQLKNVLTSKNKQKIVHNVQSLNAILLPKYAIRLSGIVDTHLAYCRVLGEAQTTTLEAAIEEVLHVPKMNLQLAVDATLLHKKVNLSKMVAFQMKLYNRLIYDCLLRDFKTNCENFATAFENLSDADAALVMNVKSTAGFEHIQLPESKKVF